MLTSNETLACVVSELLWAAGEPLWFKNADLGMGARCVVITPERTRFASASVTSAGGARHRHGSLAGSPFGRLTLENVQEESASPVHERVMAVLADARIWQIPADQEQLEVPVECALGGDVYLEVQHGPKRRVVYALETDLSQVSRAVRCACQHLLMDEPASPAQDP